MEVGAVKKFEKLKRTPWFGARVDPVRPGIYERLYLSGNIFFARWTGQEWRYGHRTIRGAAKERSTSWACARWRGLAEELVS